MHLLILDHVRIVARYYATMVFIKLRILQKLDMKRLKCHSIYLEKRRRVLNTFLRFDLRVRPPFVSYLSISGKR